MQQLQYAHLIHKVTEQQQEWSGLYDKFLHEGMVNKAAAPSKQVCVCGWWRQMWGGLEGDLVCYQHHQHHHHHCCC